MPQSATPPSHFIGCDVGKSTIAVFDASTGKLRSVANTPEDLRIFAAELDQHCLVVCEATGGYETALLAALLAAEVPAHRADPRKVKAFIRSYGTLAKTDALDARALAQYARERHPHLTRWQARDPQRLHLQALVLLWRDLVKDRLAYANRRDAPNADPAKPTLEAVVTCLEQQIKALEAQISALVEACEPIARSVRVLQTIPGIGPKTAAALVALMPELGSIDRRKAAALAGLAPHPSQSGAKDAYRLTRGGRPEVKRTLFMAALSARKHHPHLKKFFERLVQNGKKPIVAITAVMRKLIVIANAKLKIEIAHIF